MAAHPAVYNVGDGGRRPDVEEGSRGHVLLSHGLTKNSPPKELHGMPTHQDYLLKQNPKGMWQKRWFILSNCQLSYIYASSQSAAH